MIRYSDLLLLLLLVPQTAPPQRYNRSVGSALWNAVTSARNQLGGVKLNSSSGSAASGGKGGGGQANQDKDAAADDRKLRAVHGEGWEQRQGAGKRGGGACTRLRLLLRVFTLVTQSERGTR